MERTFSLRILITVISLLLAVIWLSPAYAAAPAFESLGQITASAMRVPGAMDMDAAGNLYVADTRGGLVHIFDTYGNLQQSLDLKVSGYGLAVTPDGSRLYVSQKKDVQIVALPSGEIVGVLTGSAVNGPEFGMAGEIDLDADGNVYVVDTAALLVKAYDAFGQFRGSFGGLGDADGQLRQVGGMAINPAGQVVVADSSALNSKIHVFSVDADANLVSVVAYSNQNTAIFGAPAMHTPRGLTFDGQGRGYFLDYLSSQVRVVSETFAPLGAYTQAGFEVGQLNNVIDAVFDINNSRLLIGCDSGRIEILGVDGGANPVYTNHAPTAPVPQGPVGGSVVASVTPTLEFANATDADGDTLTYQIRVLSGDLVVYQAEVAAAAGATTSTVVTNALDENAAYSWTVQAFDADQASEIASATFVVNAVDEAPAAPELLAPKANASIVGADLLSWTEPAVVDPNDYVSGYQLEVASDATFTNVLAVQSADGTSLPLASLAGYDALVAGEAYFWRVSALDSGQLASLPSPSSPFVYSTTGLIVTANMPDAIVSFHGNHAYTGQVVGTTPLELRDLASGEISVVVTRNGFEPFVTLVSLVEGENVDLYVELIPSMHVANLRALPNSINGRKGLRVNGSAVPFVVDFDKDGDLDMLVGDAAGQVNLFRNLVVRKGRRLSFGRALPLGLPVMPGAVPFVADWNNDGRNDLIVGQADGSVKLFINNSNRKIPVFGKGVDIQAAGSALSVGSNAAASVVDYNGDGAKDLLLGNGAGQVSVCLNQGDDASPVLAAPSPITQVSGGVIPALIDWNASGSPSLLLTVNGEIAIYREFTDGYRAIKVLGDSAAGYSGAFIISLDDAGKDLVAGKVDGEVVFLSSVAVKYNKSYVLALQDKVDELAGLVAEQSPAMLGDVAQVGSLIEAADYEAAATAANAIAATLSAGGAQVSALQLAALCQ